MQAFFYVELIDQPSFGTSQNQYSYHKPLLDFLQSTHPEVITYSLDNYSDRTVLHYAEFLIKQVTSFCVFLDFQSINNDSISLPAALMRQIPPHKHQCCLLFNQEQSVLKPYIQLLGKDRVALLPSLTVQEQYLREFYGDI